MNKELRKSAVENGFPLMDYILIKMRQFEELDGIKKTIFAACPNSLAVIKASLRAAKRNNAPIKFAATLNQVDMDGGYTGYDQKSFVDLIKKEAKSIAFSGPVIIAVDHGGPWLKDIQKQEQWPLSKAMEWVKRSFEESILAGYDLLHVDPTVDIFLGEHETIDISVVANRTLDLIEHAEKFRKKHNRPRIAYEVGTEEVHGGLADMQTFNDFLTRLKKGLDERGLGDVWPCFVVGKVGTDLHTSHFDPEVAKKLYKEAWKYGSVIKGHYSDNVDNPEDYPASSMGAANVGPEFTECEYEGLMELVKIDGELNVHDSENYGEALKTDLWNAVIKSNRWQKWLSAEEKGKDFYELDVDRQEWLIKTGCRYIWTDTKVQQSRAGLYMTLEKQGIRAEDIVLCHIEKAIDKYYRAFNIIDLNNIF